MKRLTVSQAVLVSAFVLVSSAMFGVKPAFADKQNQSNDIAQVPSSQEIVDSQSPIADIADPTASVVYVAILTIFGANVIKALKS